MAVDTPKTTLRANYGTLYKTEILLIPQYRLQHNTIPLLFTILSAG